MRRIEKLMGGWTFRQPGHDAVTLDLPHTWNAKDGQDGGNDYWRGTCTYENTFPGLHTPLISGSTCSSTASTPAPT